MVEKHRNTPKHHENCSPLKPTSIMKQNTKLTYAITGCISVAWQQRQHMPLIMLYLVTQYDKFCELHCSLPRMHTHWRLKRSHKALVFILTMASTITNLYCIGRLARTALPACVSGYQKPTLIQQGIVKFKLVVNVRRSCIQNSIFYLLFVPLVSFWWFVKGWRVMSVDNTIYDNACSDSTLEWLKAVISIRTNRPRLHHLL